MIVISLKNKYYSKAWRLILYKRIRRITKQRPISKIFKKTYIWGVRKPFKLDLKKKPWYQGTNTKNIMLRAKKLTDVFLGVVDIKKDVHLLNLGQNV